MKIFQQLTDGAASTLPDSDDAHLIVELMYQPVVEQRCDEQGVWHTLPIHVELSGSMLVRTILLLEKLRADAGRVDCIAAVVPRAVGHRCNQIGVGG